MTKLLSIADPQFLDEEIGPQPGRTTRSGRDVSNVGDLLLRSGGGFFAQINPQRMKGPPVPPEGESFLVHAVGDFSGGLLLIERGHIHDSMVSLSGKDGKEMWHYESSGRLVEKGWTVNYDNQVGIVEIDSEASDAGLLILDSVSGKTLQRIPFPKSSTTVRSLKCIPGDDLVNTRPSDAGSVMTSSDGNIYVQVATHKEMSDATCKSGDFSFENSLWLLKVTPAGDAQWYRFVVSQADGSGPYKAQPRVFAGETIPDGLGGVLAAWTYFFPGDNNGGKPRFEARVSRINSSQQFDYTLPLPGWTANPLSLFDENMVLGERDTLYATDRHSLVSFDIKSGKINWVRTPPTGGITIHWSTAGGGILVSNRGECVFIDYAGNLTNVPWTVKTPTGSGIGLVQVDPTDRAVAAPIQLRELQGSWFGNLLGVEKRPPNGDGAIIQFALR